MAEWTLTFEDETRTLKGWGMSRCVITQQSLSAGMFTAQIPGDMLRTLPWEYEDVITLKLDGVTKFKGVALDPEHDENGYSQNIVVRFADPWWYLGQGTYEQPWWVPGGGGAQDSAMVALFATINPGVGWLKSPISAQIEAIIEACNTYFGGEVMQMGDLLGTGFHATPIPQRINNASYETVLRQVLGHAAGAIQQWEYPEDGLPRLSFVQRSEATARTYSFADNGVIVERKFKKRSDLMVRGVQITYAGMNDAGQVYRIVDAAGETTGTRLVKAVIDCGGNARGAAATSATTTPAQTRTYTVVSEAVEMTKEWWFKYGDTGAAAAADITVLTGSEMVFAPNAPENEGKDNLGGCGLQWLEGGMPKSRLSANTRVALVKGELLVRTTKTEDSESEPITTTQVEERRTVKLLMPVTKLSGEYEQVISEASTTINSAIPQIMTGNFITLGLAAELLAAWSVAQYDGALKVVKSECDEPVMLGDVINVTGGLAEWAEMNTQVHSLTRDIDSGTTMITTGAAEHLGIEEYADLLPMTTLRTVVAADLNQQSMGEVPAGAPDPDELDDLVGPGAVKSSVSYGEQKITITTSTAVHLTDMKAEGGPKISNKDTGSGDEVVTTPGELKVRNEAAEKTVKVTPDELRLEAADGSFISHETENNRTLYQDAEGNTCEVKPTKIEVLDSAGDGVTLTRTGLVIREGGEETSLTLGQLRMIAAGLETTIEPGRVVVTDGSGTSTLEAAHLLLDEGGGITNSLTGEQIVLDDGTNTTVIEAGETSIGNGSGDALSLKPNEVKVVDGGGNSSTMSCEGGFQNAYGGQTAKLFVGSVNLNDGASGIVDIYTVAGQTINFKDTEGCDVDDAGEPITTSAPVLRGEATEV